MAANEPSVVEVPATILAAAADELANKQWLLTDGLGGYACGNGLDMPRRRYDCWLTALSPDGRRVRLVAGADVFITNYPARVREKLGFNFAALEKLNSRLIYASFSGYGDNGPEADKPGFDTTAWWARSGMMDAVRAAGAPPARSTGGMGDHPSSLAVLSGILMALYRREKTGRGAEVTSSLIANGVWANAFLVQAALCGAVFPERKPREHASNALATFYQCRDGEWLILSIHNEERLWPELVACVERPELAGDPRFLTKPDRLVHARALIDELDAAFAARDRDDWRRRLNARGILFEVVAPVTDVPTDRQALENDILVPFSDSELKTVNSPFWISGETKVRPRMAPEIGQHTDEVLATVAESRRTAQPPSANPPLPLAGVRVIDLCASWAGPIACELLADLGAEVIRVENPHMWQPMTRGHQAHPTKEGLASMQPWTGGYPDGEPGDRPWNRSPSAITCSRNKYSMSCDLRTAEGKGILARLVAVSDVVIENSVTETMEKLGVTYDWLTSIKPDIIYLRGPGFGNTGPRKNVRGVGVSMEAFIGHPLLRCYPDIGPMSLTAIYPSDALAGAYGAFNALAALHFRGKTGEGQLIETAQAEAAIGLLPEYVIDYVLNGRLHDSIANRDLYGRAPSGVYPCAGDDRWIAITIEDDNAWRRFVAVTGLDPLADLGFTANARRLAAHDQLDAAIAGWTATQERDALFLRLQAAGVAAGPVLNAADVYADPHVRARGFLLTVDHGSSGKREWPGLPFRYSGTPLGIRKPSPDMGEDNEYIYRTVLGYSAEEYARFRGSGQVTEDYDEDVP